MKPESSSTANGRSSGTAAQDQNSLSGIIAFAAQKLPSPGLPLFLGFFMILSYVLCLSMIHGTYSGMSEREKARKPIPSQTETANLFTFERATNYSGAPAQGLMVKVLEGTAPLPPGVNRYPAPGETLISPALANSLSVGKLSPWGKVVGILPESMLSTPTEQYFLAAVHEIPDENLDRWTPTSGYGQSSGFPLGDGLYVPTFSFTAIMLSLFLLAPGLLIIWVSLWTSEQLRHRVQAFRDLSAPPRLILGYGATHVLRPLATALVTVWVAYGLFLSGLIPAFPFLDVKLVPGDVARAGPWLFGGSVLLVPLAIGVAGISALRLPAVAETGHPRPTKTSWYQRKGYKFLGYCFLALSLFSFYLLMTKPEITDEAAHLLLFLSLASVCVGLPFLASWIIRGFYFAISLVSCTGSWIVGRAKFLSHLPTVRSLMTLVCFALSISGAGSIYNSQINSNVEALIVSAKLTQAQAIEILRLEDPDQINPDFRSRLSKFGALVRLAGNESDSRTTSVIVDPTDLERHFPGPEGRQAISDTLHNLMLTNFEIMPLLRAEEHVQAVLVLAPKLDQFSVMSLATYWGYSSTPPHAGYLGSHYIQKHLADWYSVFTFPIFLILLTAILLLLRTRVRNELTLAELRTEHDWSHRQALSVTLQVVTFPIIVITGASLLIYFALVQAFVLRTATYAGYSNLALLGLIALGATAAITTTVAVTRMK